MLIRPICLSCLAAVFAAAPASAIPPGGEPAWRLAFEDRFDRKEVGGDWFLRQGRAEITDGRLFLSGAGATILVDRPFAPDVRLEFTAEANPALPPCDLSAALGSSNFWGWEYLLAFGGNNNQLNQILGGTAGKVDGHPPFLIEHGKKYRIRAAKEGRRLSLEVNGIEVLSSEDEDPVGGPGFDRVGLVTWNGMYVDDLRVLERTTPAHGGPVILRAFPDLGFRWKERKLSFEGPAAAALGPGIEAYNARKYAGALELFSGISPPTIESAAGIAYVVGDLAWEERPEDREKLAALASDVARRSPGDPRARDFALAAEWFRRITVASRDRRAVTRLGAPGPAENPFFYKAELYRARYHFAAAAEGADPRRKEEALVIFRSLKSLWPEHQALREFSGEEVPWREDLIRPESQGPAWARGLEECFRRQHAILEWWFTVRQAPDGQLGGGWGDDVEILRSWVPVASITTAGETAVRGIEKMAEGVFRDVLKDGYVGEIGDVEHNAEPSGDALPGMILLRYGDPRSVERNLRSAKTIREKFLDRNVRGRLQFLSAEFGTDGVNRHPRAGGDTGYHARAMRHFLWLAWWGIPEAERVFLDWCDTWREVTVEAIGSKPPGFAPATIFFPSGGIDPPGGKPWCDPASHYYGFPGLPGKIHESLLSAAWLSGDRKFLDPVETMLDLSARGPLEGGDLTLPPDHPRNLLAHLSHQGSADILAVHRWLTGDRTFDDYLASRGSAPQRFLASGSLEDFGKAFEGLARSLRFGWTLRTSEVLQTDRAGLQGAAEVLGAYTGAVRDFRDSGAITLAATWETGDPEFAAIVTEASRTRLRARLFGFGGEVRRVGLRPWRLLPGRYALLLGELMEGGGKSPDRYAWLPAREVEHTHRGAPIRFDLPPGKTWIVDLRLREERPRPSLLPDLAIAARDVRLDVSRVAVTVHNIGAAGAGSFSIALQAREDGGWKEEARIEVEGLPEIRNFEPVTREVALTMPPPFPERSEALLRVVLDPDERLDEICETNNAVPVPLNR